MSQSYSDSENHHLTFIEPAGDRRIFYIRFEKSGMRTIVIIPAATSERLDTAPSRGPISRALLVPIA